MHSKTLTTLTSGLAIYITTCIISCILLFSTGSLIAQVTPADLLVGLTAHYPLDNNGNDISGNNYNGVPSNVTAVADRMGTANSAYQFSSTSSVVTLNNNSPIISNTVFSISAWANMYNTGGGTSSNVSTIFSQRDNSTGNVSTIVLNSEASSGTARFNLRTYGNSGQNVQGPNAGYSNWVHYTGVSDGSTIKLYINGNLVGTSPISSLGSVTTSIDHVEIGRQSYGGGVGGSLYGVIDDVRIYNRALTSDEVEYLACPAQTDIDINDTTISAGAALNFNNYQTLHPHTWTIDGTQVSTSTSLTHQFNTPGTYEVVLSSTDGFCTSYDTVSITVSANPCYPSSSSFTLSDSLILHYPFDGNANDVSGNNLFPTLYSSPTLTSDRFGNINSAYDFDGINDYMQRNNPTQLDVVPRTMSIWFKPDIIPSSNSPFISYQGDNMSTGMIFATLTSAGNINLSAGGYPILNAYSGSSLIGDWHNLVLTTDGTTNYYYLDGVLFNTNTYGTANVGSTTPTANFVLGRHRTGGSGYSYFNGQIDDVRYYSRELSASEVEYLYCPSQTEIDVNDTLITSGTTLNFNNFCTEYPHTWYVNGSQYTTDTTLNYTFNSVGVNQVVLSSTDGFCVSYDTTYVRILPPATCLGVDSASLISETSGSFNASLTNYDHLGNASTSVSDMNNDGIPEMVIGAPGDDDGATDVGALYIINTNTSALVTDYIKISADSGNFGTGLDAGDQFGYSIAPVGDLNNDGYPDVAVGAPYDDDGGINRGAVWILFLDSAGVVSKQKISDTQGGLSESLSNNDNFGYSVNNIGDLNNDGFEDIAIGMPYDYISSTNDGSVLILFLNANGTVSSEAKISRSSSVLSSLLSNGDQFGSSVANLGDINGDGNDELAIGSTGYDGTGTNQGAAYIVSVTTAGNPTNAHRIASFEHGFGQALANNSNFGSSVSSVGDIDNDGYAELAVSQSASFGGSGTQGAIYLFSLDTSGYVFNTINIHVGAGISGLNTSSSDLLGSDLSMFSDFNNDGFPDLLAGASNRSDGGSEKGAFYLLTLIDTCCPLIVDFDGDENFCVGSSITYTDNSQFTNSGDTFTWYVNDSLITTGQSLTYTFSQAGTHLVRLEVNGDCNRSFTKQVTSHLPTVADAGNSSYLCFGDSIQLNANGGVQFQWDNVPLLSNDTISNPIAFPTTTTIFSVTTTDTNGCSDVDNVAIIVTPTPVFSVSGDSLICLGQSATLTASNNSLSYNWYTTTNPNLGVTGNPAILYPSNTEIYIAEGTDGFGCSDTIHHQVIIDTSLQVSVTAFTDATCYQSNNGTINTNTVGGVPTYNYMWSNNQTSANIQNLAPGNYSITVTDARGCQDSAFATITEPDSISNTFLSDSVLCFGGSDGSLTANPTGGTPGYSYTWITGDTTTTISSLSAGGYDVTITDSNGCSNSFYGVIEQPTVLTSSTAKVQDVYCSGGTNGKAYVMASGGTSPYSYTWSNGTTTDTNSTLSVGLAYVTVTDNNGCSTIDSILIDEPLPLAGNISIDNQVSCYGLGDGVATANVTGGTTPYSYSWSNGELTQQADSLFVGSNSVTVTDSLGCTISLNTTITQPDSLIITVDSIQDVQCYGIFDGKVFTSVSGGTVTYTYNWSNSDTSSNIENLAPGSYSVTVTDNNGCQDTASASIVQPDSISNTFNSDSVLCFEGSDGSLTANPTGGTSGYSYSWGTGDTTATISSQTAGSYTVTISDAHNCINTFTGIIEEPTELTSSTFKIQDVSCFGGSNGAAYVSANGGIPTYDFAWSNGVTTDTNSTLMQGLAFVTITDNNGCTKVDSIQIDEPAILAGNVTIDSQVTCFGYSNGTATANPTGGTSPYSYLWSNGEDTQQADSLLVGSHTVTITDSLGCIGVLNTTITQPTPVVATLDSTRDVLCNGFYDGSAYTSASGGTGSHSFIWNTGDTLDDIDSLTSGTYILTVYDSLGCFDTTAITIIELTPVIPNISGTDISCFDYNDGYAEINPIGGGAAIGGNYYITWSDSSSGLSIDSLYADTYWVKVNDDYNCYTYDTIVLSQPDSIQFAFDVSDITCTTFQNGEITASVTGGTLPYSYSWSNGGTDSTINTLDSGYYALTITDANSCFNQDSAYIFEPSPLASQTTLLDSVDCFGNSNGSAFVTVTGGVGQYEYNWNSGDTTDTILGKSSQTYFVTITDSNACTLVDSIYINEPNLLTIQVDSLLNVNCKDEANAFASVIVTGGNGTNSYAWNTGDTNYYIDSLTDGIYSVTVVDHRGCTDSLEITITEPDSLFAFITYTDTLTCQYDGDGELTASATGGTQPYNYSWLNGTSTATNNNLSDGNYAVTITDDHGCIDSTDFNIFAQSHIVSSVDSVYDILCNSDQSGFIKISADSGAAPYSYSWNNGSSLDTNSNLNGGTYFYTISDTYGCVDSGNAFVFEPTPLVTTVDSVFRILCYGADDGSIYTSASGGMTPYSWQWSNGDDSSYVNTLDSGMYAYTVTDSNGCTISDSALIMEPALPISNSFAINDANCLGGANGDLTAQPTGGTSPYFYQWSNGDTLASTFNLVADTYSVVIADSFNCMFYDTVVINQPSSPDTAITQRVNISCFGYDNGILTAEFVNGYAPYQFAWSTSETADSIFNLTPGAYSVTVIDSVGCTQVAFDTILEPDTLIATILELDSIQCFGDNTSNLFSQVTGGTSPYAYNWSTSDTTAELDSLFIGSYSVTVSDFNGCTDSSNYLVTQPDSLVIDSLFYGPASCYGFSDAIGFVSANGGSLPYSFMWSTGESSDSAFTLSEGSQSVIVTDIYGCQVDTTMVISQPDSLVVDVNVLNPANCDNSWDGSLIASATGGNGGYQYMWSNTDADSILNDAIHGTYTVTLTDSKGCLDSMDYYLPFENNSPYLNLGNDTFFCNDTVYTLSDQTQNVDKVWNNFETSDSITVYQTGEYWLEITDSAGCMKADTILVEMVYPTEFDLGNDSLVCTDRGLQLVELGTEGFVTYNWSTGDTNSHIIIAKPGNYALEVSNEYGCLSSDSIRIDYGRCFDPLVYPIPTVNNLYVEWPRALDEDLKFTLLSTSGALIWEKTRPGQIRHEFLMEEIGAGSYFLIIEGSDFKIQYRIVKS